MRWKPAACAVLAWMALALSLRAQSDRWVVIRAGHLFDSQRAVFFSDAVVVVHDERIAAVGTAEHVKIVMKRGQVARNDLR